MWDTSEMRWILGLFIFLSVALALYFTLYIESTEACQREYIIRTNEEARYFALYMLERERNLRKTIGLSDADLARLRQEDNCCSVDFDKKKQKGWRAFIALDVQHFSLNYEIFFDECRNNIETFVLVEKQKSPKTTDQK